MYPYTSKEFDLLRQRTKSFDNRQNGFGQLGLQTVLQFGSFTDTVNLFRSGASMFRNPDGSVWVPNINELLPGLDIPPIL